MKWYAFCYVNSNFLNFAIRARIKISGGLIQRDFGFESHQMFGFMSQHWWSCSHCPRSLLPLVGDLNYSLQTKETNPDSKAHGANMGPTWGRQDPGVRHVDPMNFVLWEYILLCITKVVWSLTITIRQIVKNCILHIVWPHSTIVFWCMR